MTLQVKVECKCDNWCPRVLGLHLCCAKEEKEVTPEETVKKVNHVGTQTIHKEMV